MGGLFFALLGIITLLFFPIYLSSDGHFDMNRRKFAFSVRAYDIFPLIGGYLATYNGGFAFHLSKRKVRLIPYNQINQERKRFKIYKLFRLKNITLTTETGAEYLFPVGVLHAFLRTYFFILQGKKEKIENNVWLTNGDVLRLSYNLTVFFNLFILLRYFVKFLKEKMICQRKTKKSTI